MPDFATRVNDLRSQDLSDAEIAARLMTSFQKVGAVPAFAGGGAPPGDSKRSCRARDGRSGECDAPAHWTDAKDRTPQPSDPHPSHDEMREAAHSPAGDGGQPERTKRTCAGRAAAGGCTTPAHGSPKVREPSASSDETPRERAATGTEKPGAAARPPQGGAMAERRAASYDGPLPPPDPKPAWLGPPSPGGAGGVDPAEAERRRLIAEHIAAHGVTQCPGPGDPALAEYEPQPWGPVFRPTRTAGRNSLKALQGISNTGRRPSAALAGSGQQEARSAAGATGKDRAARRAEGPTGKTKERAE